MLTGINIRMCTHTVSGTGSGRGEPTRNQAHLIPQAPSPAELNLGGLLPDKGSRSAHPPHGELWGRTPAPRRSPALDLKSERCGQLSCRLRCYWDLGSSGENQRGDWGEEAGGKVPPLFFPPRCCPEAVKLWGAPLGRVLWSQLWVIWLALCA